MQSLAILDAILEPEWEYRYYSFNTNWAPGATMGSMRNGSGDEFFVLFSEAGCFIKGFDHEAADHDVPVEAFYAQLPPPFDEQSREVAFSPEYVTFCYWRQTGAPEWSAARVPAYASTRDGSEDLLAELDGNPGAYRTFAEDYYECAVDAEAVAAFYDHRPLTPELAAGLNAATDWAELAVQAAEIGYPLSQAVCRSTG